MRNVILAVVVTYNRLEMLKDCLLYLLHQSIDAFDILVVNNNSSDGTDEYLREFVCPRLNYINTNENLGGAGGFNLGLKYAVKNRYDYAWLIDDDVNPDKNALKELLKASCCLSDFGYLAGSVYDKENKLCLMNIPTYVKNMEIINNYKRIKSSTFVSFFIKIAIVKEIGLPIQEFFIWADDIEYTLRISNKYPCYEVPDSHVTHLVAYNVGSSIYKDLPERIGRYFFSYRNEYYIYKHRKRNLLFFYVKCLYDIVRIIFLAKNKKVERIKVLLAGFWAGIKFNPSIEMI